MPESATVVRTTTDPSDWPSWVPRVAAVPPVLTGAMVLWQRDAWWPWTWSTLFVAVILTPWLVETRSVRHVPRWLFAGVVLVGTQMLLLSPAQDDLAPFFLVYLAAEVAATSRLRTAVGVALGAEAVILLAIAFGADPDVYPWLIGIAFGFAGGAAIGLQFRLLTESRAAADASAERAAAEERQRIAREVHDVVAHSLSAVMLHLTGVRRELETGGDAQQAAEALREAEHAGREALAEIRRTVGILGPGSATQTQPLPGAGDVAELAERTRSAGLDLRWSVTGDPTTVPSTVGLALYRIAQEALANAAKHSPGGSVELTLDFADDVVTLRVANTGRPGVANGDGGGMGLHGMADRVAVLGGRFRAGPAPEGWVVEVALPRTATEPV